MILAEFRQQIKNKLQALFTEREAKTVTDELLCHFLQLKKSDIFLQEKEKVADGIVQAINKAIVALEEGRPLQYVLGIAFFYDSDFFVNEQVLIPRPETEELVHWIVQDYQSKEDLYLLDIGTGSGCIPLSLKKAMPQHQITGVDISEGALEVAMRNAAELKMEVAFEQIDVLDEKQWLKLSKYDVIVSNPPYIPHSEKVLMKDNVLVHEPHLALFVENDDALIFYEKIADFALQKLNPNGALYFECNEYNATDVAKLLALKSFTDVEIKKDMSGKDRMVKGRI